MKYTFEPIGILNTCFKEKFGIPRQPSLASGAEGVLKLRKDPQFKTALQRIEEFSHLWVVFVFHESGLKDKEWKPSIRPPRLGGAKKVGVFASRSPHRPNPIGLSVVKLEHIDWDAKGGIEIHVSGVDILDGTPVLDIKPYLPYADSLPDANPGWAGEPIARTAVEFSGKALRAIQERATAKRPASELQTLITQMLELDPRPAFQKRRMPADHPKAQGARYGFSLLDYDVKWEIRDGKFHVLDVVDL